MAASLLVGIPVIAKMPITTDTDSQQLALSPSGTWKAIRSISKTVSDEDSFYVCDVDSIRRQDELWKSHLPHVTPFYAVKCNDDPMVLHVHASLGNGFDCASKTEIQRVLSMGVSPDRIVFAHPTKTVSQIRYAASVGVTTMTFDNECELYKIRNVCPQAKLVLRIRSDAKKVMYNLGKKFGCDPVADAPELIRLAKSLDLDLIGVCFHVGSGCHEPRAYYRAIAAARQLFDYAGSLDYDLTLLDIGGGFPAIDGLFDQSAVEINAALEEFFGDVPRVRFISEPGQFFVTKAYTLVCNVHTVKKADEESRRIYYLNDGVYRSFLFVLAGQAAPIPYPLERPKNKELFSSSLWGQTCDGLDLIANDVLLPELKVGDWIAFENMGAYTLTLNTPFNGFSVPKVQYVIKEKLWSALRGRIKLSDDNIIVEEE